MSVAVDPLPDALDPTQFPGIQVWEFAGALFIVAHHHRSGTQSLQTPRAQASQPQRHHRDCQPKPLGEVKAGEPPSP